jgi:hypothetical protein
MSQDVPRKARPLVEAAKRHGFVLVRRNKHLIFKNADGLTLVSSATVGDRRAIYNMERDIKRLLKQQ